jgi:hypothetical protein
VLQALPVRRLEKGRAKEHRFRQVRKRQDQRKRHQVILVRHPLDSRCDSRVRWLQAEQAWQVQGLEL